ncbi:MAG TPA: glycosyltransferase [Streptosporangiaceae bacterium]|nr:glycosyltransferase [Streptosporangiaceae bacterium]
MYEPFSLLVPVYHRDRPEFLRRSLRSAVADQTVRPDQVVIVRDGPVGDGLAACLAEFTATSTVPVTMVALPHNLGLGPALDQGLAACWHDVVARMDADDVAMPHRFEVELPLIADADIVGAGLLEFVTDTDEVVGQRVPPTDPDRIRRYARMHDPFNHPTVVYRRQAVLAAGGYGDLPLMEDYALFARMLANGARPVNVAEPLVYYRVGATAFKRRGGTALLRSELRLQREFRRSGFTTRAEYVRNIAVRGGYRLVPWWARRAVYKPVVARYSEGRPPPGEDADHPQEGDWEYADEWNDDVMSAAGAWRDAGDEPSVPVRP